MHNWSHSLYSYSLLLTYSCIIMQMFAKIHWANSYEAHFLNTDSPMNLHLEEANTTHLKFSWDTFFRTCPPFRYDIHTTNCGSCLESVDSATVVCNNLQISTDAQLCSIAVQSRCNEVVGNTSDILQVVLKGNTVFNYIIKLC